MKRTQTARDIGAKFSSAQVVVQHGNVDLIQQPLGLFNRAGRFGHISVFAQDGGAQQEIVRVVIQQQHANGRGSRLYQRQRGVLVVRGHK
jgi:hypothetical protein